MEALISRLFPNSIENLTDNDAVGMPLPPKKLTREKKTTEAASHVFKFLIKPKLMEPPAKPKRAAINKALRALKKSLFEVNEANYELQDAQTKLNKSWTHFLECQEKLEKLQETLCLDFSSKTALKDYKTGFNEYKHYYAYYSYNYDNYEDTYFDYHINIRQFITKTEEYTAAINSYAVEFGCDPEDTQLREKYGVEAMELSLQLKASYQECEDIIDTFKADTTNYLSDKGKFLNFLKSASQVQRAAPGASTTRITKPKYEPPHFTRCPPATGVV